VASSRPIYIRLDVELCERLDILVTQSGETLTRVVSEVLRLGLRMKPSRLVELIEEMNRETEPVGPYPADPNQWPDVEPTH
jgi:hypothetical protein